MQKYKGSFVFIFSFFILTYFNPLCFAAGNQTLSPITFNCILESAHTFDLPPLLLISILAVEGGKVGGCSINKDKQGNIRSVDIGPMQINSNWLSTFKKSNILGNDLQNNGCLNVYVGAWILKKTIISHSNFWVGVGGYNSMTPTYNYTYQQKVYKHLKKIQQRPEYYITSLIKRINKYVE